MCSAQVCRPKVIGQACHPFGSSRTARCETGKDSSEWPGQRGPTFERAKVPLNSVWKQESSVAATAKRAASPEPGSGLDAAVLRVARDGDSVGGGVFTDAVETPGCLRSAVERQPDVAEC